MPDDDSTGPSRATRAVITVLALPVILVAAFIVVGTVHSGQKAALPALQTKGLKWAQARAKTAGFDNVDPHDALGRDRGSGDTKSWMVCFQTPEPTKKYAHKTLVKFGVVRVTEACPPTDQGTIGRAGLTMPNFRDRTAYMANVSLGDDASVRYIDASTNDGVDRDLGDYRVCDQRPLAGAAWDGVPVTLAVLPYAQDCNHPKLDEENSDMKHAKKLSPSELFQRVIALARKAAA